MGATAVNQKRFNAGMTQGETMNKINELVKQTWDKITDLQKKRAELQHDHAIEIGTIDRELNTARANMAMAVAMLAKDDE